MKNLFLLSFLLLIGGNSYSQCSDLFFSEYIEGSSSNKALEIYNPKSTSIDLSDYVIYRANNGSLTPTDSIYPVGVLNSKEVFIVANPSANASILAEADTTHTITFFNGDDAVWMQNIITGDTLDIIGEIGVDPGSGWVVGAGSTVNYTLIRDISIQEGNTNWTTAVNEWNVFPIDMIDSLGFHSMTPCVACSNTFANINDTACFTYISPSGNYIWTTSNNYLDTIPNASGCDSIISIDLIINTIDTSLTVNPPMITSNEIAASYQWLDCVNAFAIITGETNQSFTPILSGNYTVEITKNNCVDTSACVYIIITNLMETDLEGLKIYPNPSNGIINIDFNGLANPSVKVYTLQAVLIYEKENIEESNFQLNLEVIPGVYFLEVRNDNKTQLYKLFIK